jgi:uncharacterized DUF497 family protein
MLGFEWDNQKNQLNAFKHGVEFEEAVLAFYDRKRIIVSDDQHSTLENRYFCFGKVNDGILTVRFAWRGDVIRIIGAGYWRKGKEFYEKTHSLHK